VSTRPAAPTDNAPIQSFSHCHEGIVAKLTALDQLPALMAAAEQARTLASTSVAFFQQAVVTHHADEERELFPAVLASATQGEERQQVQALVDRLTREHREIEARWKRLEPGLKALGKGQSSTLDAQALQTLVGEYQAHAKFEEDVFLPLSQTILGRNSNHMAALGLSLHIRQVMPEVLGRGDGHL